MKRILVLGVEQNNFLSFLYGSLKKKYPEFIIKVPFYKEIKKNVEVNDWMYNNEGINKKPRFISHIRSFLFVLFSLHHWETFLFILLFEKKIKKSVHFLKSSIFEKAFFIENNNFFDIDVFHFHYLQYSYIRNVFLIPKNKKIVCSFWGSDLMRTSDTFNHYFVKKALKRTNIITCQSAELKQIILSKFGRDLDAKITVNSFAIDQQVFQNIFELKGNKEKQQVFKGKYGFSQNKINILLGHNGSPQNMHTKIIEQFVNITVKDKVHLIVNLNYAINKKEFLGYLDLIKENLEKTEITYTILENFFVKEELALSRLATDIFIHMPTSDALSATLTEFLFAEKIVITGSWLPYKILYQQKIHCIEVNEFEELPKMIDSLVENYEGASEEFLGNSSKVEKYFFRDGIIDNWKEILSK